jgi:Tfp pilus assembly protein PilF
MAVSADRQSSEAWFYLAEWHRQYGDKQLAITDFNAVIQLNKDPDLVKQATELRDKLAAPAEGTK